MLDRVITLDPTTANKAGREGYRYTGASLSIVWRSFAKQSAQLVAATRRDQICPRPSALSQLWRRAPGGAPAAGLDAPMMVLVSGENTFARAQGPPPAVAS